MEKSIGELITEETEKRLKLMAQPDYEFPERMNKADVAAILVSITVCTALILCCYFGVL